MKTLGLDIGGANIKAAHSDGAAISEPFPLWRQPTHLFEHIRVANGRIGCGFDRVAVTMTAELCDCFETKREGVGFVLDVVDRFAEGVPVRVWSTNGGFVSVAAARAEPLKVAASNWHAWATFAARYPGDAMIDVGSTTTDIVRRVDRQPVFNGLTDMDRLATGELEYLGVRRTPVAALGPSVALNRTTYSVMSEFFATTADVFVLTGDLPEAPDCLDTPDTRPLTRAFAAARLLRMIGADTEMSTLENAVKLAHSFHDRMLGRLERSLRQVMGGGLPEHVLVSGSGEFFARKLALWLEIEPIPVSEILGFDVSAAACAHALVRLADELE